MATKKTPAQTNNVGYDFEPAISTLENRVTVIENDIRYREEQIKQMNENIQRFYDMRDAYKAAIKLLKSNSKKGTQ